MAWSEKHFEQGAEYCATRTNDTADVAHALYQLDALLAERLPKPGARLYRIMFPVEGGVTIDLDKLVAVFDPIQIGSGSGYSFSIEGPIIQRFSFSLQGSCRDAHAKLLAARGCAP